MTVSDTIAETVDALLVLQPEQHDLTPGTYLGVWSGDRITINLSDTFVHTELGMRGARDVVLTVREDRVLIVRGTWQWPIH